MAGGRAVTRTILPSPDNRTLSRYLISVSETIHREINGGLEHASAQRLRECATVAARVAQHIDAPAAPVVYDVAAEIDALAGAEHSFADAESVLWQAGVGAPPQTARRIDGPALERYLRGHAKGGAQVRVETAKLLSGGRCKTTALLTQSGAVDLPASFILRQDWDGGATDTTVSGEFELISRLHARGLVVPAALLIEEGESEVGLPFILLECMPGKVLGSLFTPPHSAALAEQLAQQMALLHAAPVNAFADCLPAVQITRQTLANELAGFRAQHEQIGYACNIIDAALEWLGAHLDDAGSAQSIVHNDLGFHNFLVDGEKLSAILDWELASFGHPAADLGYVKPFVRGMCDWEAFLGVYQGAGGWRVDERELRFHTIWNAVRLYGLIMRARAAIAGDHVRDMEITFAVADNVMLLLNALGQELRVSR